MKPQGNYKRDHRDYVEAALDRGLNHRRKRRRVAGIVPFLALAVILVGAYASINVSAARPTTSPATANR